MSTLLHSFHVPVAWNPQRRRLGNFGVWSVPSRRPARTRTPVEIQVGEMMAFAVVNCNEEKTRFSAYIKGAAHAAFAKGATMAEALWALRGEVANNLPRVQYLVKTYVVRAEPREAVVAA